MPSTRHSTTTPAESPDFTWPVRVYWEDTDAGGIVFYANYLKFFERARTEWLRNLGLEQESLRESGGMFVVCTTQIGYHSPARLDDALLIQTRLRHKGRVGLRLEQEARLQSQQGDGRLLCSGVIEIAWVQTPSLKPARIPADLWKVLS